MNGIYQYRDLKTNKIVYIGKDSYLDINKRHNQHMQPSNYDTQVFNRALQNNPERYRYEIVYAGDFSEDMLNTLEINTIAEFKLMNNGKRPKFNYTDGGQGNKYWLGKKRSKETRELISNSKKGKQCGENNPFYGKKHPPEIIEYLKEVNTGENNHNWKEYARVIKNGKRHDGKQRYCIKMGGRIIKESVHINRLVNWFNEKYPNQKIITESD